MIPIWNSMQIRYLTGGCDFWQNEGMPSATEISSTLSAVAALLAGLAAVINSVLKINKNTEGGPPDSGSRYTVRAATFASYSVLFGFLAWLLTVLFLVLIHVVTTPQWFIALRAVQSVAGVLAILGAVCCVLNFYQPIRHEAAVVRPWLSGAGLVISLGVLAVLIIAGL